MLNGYYDSWGSAAFNFYVAPQPGGHSSYFCADWEGGTSTCDITIPTVNRSFAYFADIHAGWTNDANQATNFYYRGYVEDLSDF